MLNKYVNLSIIFKGIKNMKKLLSAIVVTFSLISFGAVQSAGFSLGVGISDGAYHGFGKETNGTDVTEEAGVFEAGYEVIFGEIAVNDTVSFGIEFVPGDFSTPTNTNIQEDITTSATSTVQTNTVKATFEDLITIYAQAKLWGPVYAKLGLMSVSVITNESLGTGGSYGNKDTDGVMFGLGLNHDLDNGMFIRFEVQASQYDDITAANTTDSTKTVTMSEMMGAQGSIRIGKTF